MPGVGLMHGFFWEDHEAVEPPAVVPIFDFPPRAGMNSWLRPERRKQDLIPRWVREMIRAQQIEQGLRGEFIKQAEEKFEREVAERELNRIQLVQRLEKAREVRKEMSLKNKPAPESKFSRQVDKARRERERQEADRDRLKLLIRMAELRARKEALERAPEEISG